MGTLAVKNFPEQHCPHLLAQLSDKPNFRHVTQELVVIGCSHVTNETNPRSAERKKQVVEIESTETLLALSLETRVRHRPNCQHHYRGTVEEDTLSRLFLFTPLASTGEPMRRRLRRQQWKAVAAALLRPGRSRTALSLCGRQRQRWRYCSPYRRAVPITRALPDNSAYSLPLGDV